jgi:aryl-alcohol dehydrogenase-like predicted oxidoreductase
VSPEFLDDQLGRALDRLGLETIDVLLLHNPEYFLTDAVHRGVTDLEATRAAFYDRLGRAFAFLDGAVADGRIGWYGVSSNTCISPPAHPEATSVTRMVEASGGRMAVLQLPYNLFETGAMFEANTPAGTALEAAASFDLGVLVNRPLNAMSGGSTGRGRLVRLADPPGADSPSGDDALRARIAAFGETEAALARLAPTADGPRVADLLLERWDELGYPQAFQQVLRGEIVPEARRGLRSVLDELGMSPDSSTVEALQAYQDAVNALIEPLQARAMRQDPQITEQIRAAISGHLPEPLRAESLSRIALGFVASTPGVSSVLCGMRQPAYVEDAVAVMTMPPILDLRSVAGALRDATTA